MADVEVVFGADDSALRAAIDAIKAKMGELDQSAVELGRKIAASFAKMGISPEAGFKLVGKEEQNALAQYGASLEKVKEQTDKLGDASRGAGINIGNMLERIALRLAIFELMRVALDAVKDAMIAASQAEEEFRTIQVGTQGSVADTNAVFDSLKKTAHDTGDDLEKFVVPAFNKLFESGMRAGEAADAVNAIGIAMQRTKIDISGVVEKAEQGAASFGDMAKAGRALGAPEFSEWARSWAQAQVAEASYTRELSHAHELMQRQIHDVEALASAHEGFAQKTGLAEAAFKAFAERGGRISPTVEIPKALADLPGGTQAFGSLLGEMQKRFQEGMAQIGKEEHLAPGLVRAGVAAELPGFGEADLLAAAKRAEQEKNLTAERKEQDQHAERIKAFDDARVNGNERIKGLLADQLKNTNDLIGATETLGDRWNKVAQTVKNIGIEAGDIAHETQRIGPQAQESVLDRPTGMHLWDPRIRSQMEYAAAHPDMRANMPGGPGGGAGEIKETNSDKIESHLRTISESLTGHGTP